MEKFTIYCTEEQTRKALELGAPIEPTFCEHGLVEQVLLENPNTPYVKSYYDIPTAEQMLEWLRSKGLRFKIAEYVNITYWQYQIKLSFKCGSELCYKDAVLSLIDAALDYLVNNRK